MAADARRYLLRRLRRPRRLLFNPTHFDADAWAALAKEAGAGYVVLTTKHHDGFALWDTKFSDFSSVNKAGRDFIGPYVEAVRKAGLKMGLYFSLPDWHDLSYPVTPTPLGTRPQKAWPPNAYHSIAEDPARWQQYLTLMNGQIRELLSNYGQIDLIWFDGGWEHTIEEWQGYDLVKMIRELQPTLIMNDRLNPHSPAWRRRSTTASAITSRRDGAAGARHRRAGARDLDQRRLVLQARRPRLQVRHHADPLPRGGRGEERHAAGGLRPDAGRPRPGRLRLPPARNRRLAASERRLDLRRRPRYARPYLPRPLSR